MQNDQFLSFDKFKPVCLFVTIFDMESKCKSEIYISPNNSFLKESWSSNTSHAFLDWQPSESLYNSYHLFGIQDPRNSNQYRFIDIEQNKYLRLSSISLPQTEDELFNSTDSRLFLMEKIIHSDMWSLRHDVIFFYIIFVAEVATK